MSGGKNTDNNYTIRIVLGNLDVRVDSIDKSLLLNVKCVDEGNTGKNIRHKSSLQQTDSHHWQNISISLKIKAGYWT